MSVTRKLAKAVSPNRNRYFVVIRKRCESFERVAFQFIQERRHIAGDFVLGALGFTAPLRMSFWRCHQILLKTNFHLKVKAPTFHRRQGLFGGHQLDFSTAYTRLSDLRKCLIFITMREVSHNLKFADLFRQALR